MSNTDRDEVVVDGKTKLIVSASNIDVGIIAGTLLVYTTLCFEALTINPNLSDETRILLSIY